MVYSLLYVLSWGAVLLAYRTRVPRRKILERNTGYDINFVNYLEVTGDQ
jgi:hypothetical protein